MWLFCPGYLQKSNLKAALLSVCEFTRKITLRAYYSYCWSSKNHEQKRCELEDLEIKGNITKYGKVYQEMYKRICETSTGEWPSRLLNSFEGDFCNGFYNERITCDYHEIEHQVFKTFPKMPQTYRIHEVQTQNKLG
jgi:hypothetical protein